MYLTDAFNTCGETPHKQGFTYLISISFFFLYSGITFSHDIVKRPSFKSAEFTFTSSAIVKDLANCLFEIPLWIISPLFDFSSDLLAAVSGGVGLKFKKNDVNIGFMNLGASGYILGFSLSNKILY